MISQNRYLHIGHLAIADKAFIEVHNYDSLKHYMINQIKANSANDLYIDAYITKALDITN